VCFLFSFTTVSHRPRFLLPPLCQGDVFFFRRIYFTDYTDFSFPHDFTSPRVVVPFFFFLSAWHMLLNTSSLCWCFFFFVFFPFFTRGEDFLPPFLFLLVGRSFFSSSPPVFFFHPAQKKNPSFISLPPQFSPSREQSARFPRKPLVFDSVNVLLHIPPSSLFHPKKLFVLQTCLFQTCPSLFPARRR